MKVTGWPIATIIRGNVVMREDTLLNDPIGAPLRFL
jgi:dihydroorotase